MPSKLLRAREVAAFTDAQLDQFLEASRLPNGDYMVEVEDPDNLPESFILRLRNRDRPRSKPVDLDQVSARLLQLAPTHRRALSTSSSSTSGTVTWEELFEDFKQDEELGYRKLTEEGGRPFYPIEKLPDVARHPEKYPEMARFWGELAESDPFWRIFSAQYHSWLSFRDYQKVNREAWKGRIPAYQKHTSRRLVKYSVKPQPVEFQEDWTQQDKLTEWIEYACYACYDMRGLKKWSELEYELRVAQLGWIADQIPLIQDEMRSKMSAGTAGVKRSRAEVDEDENGEPSAKKQKTGGSEGAAARAWSPKPLSGPRSLNSAPSNNTELEPVPAAPEHTTEGTRKRPRQRTPEATDSQVQIPTKRTRNQQAANLATTALAQRPLRRSRRIAEANGDGTQPSMTKQDADEPGQALLRSRRLHASSEDIKPAKVDRLPDQRNPVRRSTRRTSADATTSVAAKPEGVSKRRLRNPPRKAPASRPMVGGK